VVVTVNDMKSTVLKSKWT